MTSKIKILRTKMGIGKIALGKLLGVRRETIFRYERNECNPSIKVAMKIIKLGEKAGMVITLSDLFEKKLISYKKENA